MICLGVVFSHEPSCIDVPLEEADFARLAAEVTHGRCGPYCMRRSKKSTVLISFKGDKMSKSVQSVKNSLKFKASPKAGILSVKIGVRKYSVPVEARMLSNGGFVFLSFPASSELYRVDGGELHSMPSDTEAGDAYAALNPGRRRRRTRKEAESAALSAELEEAIKGIPPGYRLGYGPDGKPRLIRTRVRRKKA